MLLLKCKISFAYAAYKRGGSRVLSGTYEKKPHSFYWHDELCKLAFSGVMVEIHSIGLLMSIPLITEQDFLHKLDAIDNPHYADYFAFYSSWFGGITTNPRFMLLPLDDHIVHRGDGVFEACKVVNRCIYLLDQHLERLYRSAEKIGIESRFSDTDIRKIILETLKVANKECAALRIFLSRGPGQFTVNPYDAIGSQLYVALTRLKLVPDTTYQKGVNIGISTVPVKVSWMAQIKSCNYLPNVLMKKEAVDRGLDFVITIDDNGHVAEGATENIIIVDSNNSLVYPRFEYALRGTTLLRTLELAANLGISSEERSITIDDLITAKEVMIVGTTLDILPVVLLEGRPIGTAKPGHIAIRLREALTEDIERASPHY